MAKNLGLISLGVFIITVAISLLLYLAQTINVWEILPTLIGLNGIWTIILAGIRAKTPSKYERGAFSTFAWGLLLTAIGGSWLSYSKGWTNMIYALVIILLILGVIAMAAALRRQG